MNICFVSNYINHHQIPFCSAMKELLEARGGSFTFVQTMPMEEERIRMGWDSQVKGDYLKLYYEEPEECRRLIREAEILIFGGVDDESCLQERLRAKKLIFRYCERMYKSGQWKAISPRGLWHKYLDHTRYRRDPVYVLCAGGYVADDFRIVHAYRNKMFCWGYFPEIRDQDVDNLLKNKGYGAENSKIPYLLWAGRMIDWKHPELAVETARYLRDRGMSFHMDMVGGGDMEEHIAGLIRRYHLEDRISTPGFQTPEQIREYMERADIFLFTSDRREGWGAVANEAMNSGCVLVADHMIGAVPYLLSQGENGCIYRDGDSRMLFETVEALLEDPGKRRELGRKAYETVHEIWNADYAARRLLELGERLLEDPQYGEKQRPKGKPAPCEPAPVISEKRMFRVLTAREEPHRRENEYFTTDHGNHSGV